MNRQIFLFQSESRHRKGRDICFNLIWSLHANMNSTSVFSLLFQVVQNVVNLLPAIGWYGKDSHHSKEAGKSQKSVPNTTLR